MRVQLRDYPSPAELAELYATPHDHHQWADHEIRVDVTVDTAAPFVPPGGLVADLSCGNGSIARRLAKARGGATLLGDYAPGYDVTGPIEDTIHQLRWKQAGMFVLSETIEHVEDPDLVLKWVREKCDNLVLSTPDGEQPGTVNREHVWGWDSGDVGKMLFQAGFKPMVYTLLDLRPAGYDYAFQIWVCR